MLQLFTMLHNLILVFNEDVKTHLKFEENDKHLQNFEKKITIISHVVKSTLEQ